MSENKGNPGMEPENNENEMDEDLIVFETEGGEEVTFRIEDYLFYNGEEYAILSEYSEEEDADEEKLECIVCRIDTSRDEHDEEIEEFVNIEDEELAEKLIEIANNRLNEDEEDE